MRNLKRALSLTLASVMLLGMMVVGSSAAGYPDVTEEENIEAIEVLQSVGVMEGDNNGNFNPDDYVTREQMAVIMSKLLNLDYNYYQGTNPFSDVPAWAAPYVAACAANGITSGIGGGMYGAGQNVNAVQAALMMLKALGYFQYQADFGEDYVLATVKQATEVGLFKLIDSNAQAALTRNEVAQMALNALQSDLVRFTGDVGIEIPNVGNVGYKSEYTPRTSTDPKYNRLIDNKHSSNIDTSGQYYCQLGEELYNGNLVKRIDSDVFERPSFTWTYKTEKIGTYVDREKLQATYTSGVSGRTLYDLLNNITIRDYDLDVYVDGHEAGKGTNYVQQYGNGYAENVNNISVAGANETITSAELRRANTENVGATADGVLTEVYLDQDNEVITIVSIHTWLAQATSAYSETRETANMKVFMTLSPSSVGSISKTINVEDVPEVTGVAADAYYLVRMSDKDTTALEVVDINEPQILAESTITKFSNGLKNNTNAAYPQTLTTDSVEYKDSDRAVYDAETLDTYDKDLLTVNTYNIYLDKYGYFIGIDLCEGTKQYVFVTGYDMRNSNLSIQTANAAGIFLDGTMKTITVNVKDTNKNIESMVTDKGDANSMLYYKPWASNASQGVYLLNRWYTYTENNGVYTLKPCVDKNGEAMMLAAKSENSNDSDGPKAMKLNASKLRLDSVVNGNPNDNEDGLLMGESMTYATTGLDSYRAYGEDESIFITVDVDEVSAVAGTNLKITKAITDVNGVYTGVQDVDMITDYTNRVLGQYYHNPAVNPPVTGDPTTNNTFWVGHDGTNNTFMDSEGKASTTAVDKYSYVGENAYAVFDKNNFIIGAIILGEAEGSNATKAYILDPVKYERYSDGTYYWQFEAVINGEIVTQEAESKFSSTIDAMRKNQYEVVELRYNAAGDIVTDVKELARTDIDGTTAGDKIYGHPFDEIKSAPTGHQVKDKESIYDVVLTGDDWNATATATSGLDQDKADNGSVRFQYVTRPRTVTPGHPTAGYDFTETDLGVLRLQGRTLYVLDGQHDYGVDFTRDAKAVVRQPENGKMKNRMYNSVEEAIGSLGDAVVSNTDDNKEFRGIITAVLNNNGVAEWVVFYSDTNVETLNDANVGQATIDVNVHVKLPGAQATKYDTIKVPRPISGNIAPIKAPVIDGYTAKEEIITIVWDKNNNGTVVTFEYETNATPDTDETMIVKINSILPGTGVITSERVISKNTQTVGGKYMINPPAYNGYECLESAKGIEFNANGAEISFTYKQLADGTTDNSAPAGGCIGDANNPAYATEYAKAGLTITSSGTPETKLVYKITGKISDIENYLNKVAPNASRPNTILQGNTDGNKLAIGACFVSPKDSTGTSATTVDLVRSGHSAGDNQNRPGCNVNNGSFIEWLTMTKAGTNDGNGNFNYTGAGREINKTLTYTATWHFAGGKTMTTSYDLVFEITK